MIVSSGHLGGEGKGVGRVSTYESRESIGDLLVCYILTISTGWILSLRPMIYQDYILLFVMDRSADKILDP